MICNFVECEEEDNTYNGYCPKHYLQIEKELNKLNKEYNKVTDRRNKLEEKLKNIIYCLRIAKRLNEPHIVGELEAIKESLKEPLKELRHEVRQKGTELATVCRNKRKPPV